MTENLLEKLEEKMMVMLTEVETLRQVVQQLQTENATLKTEKEKHVQDLTNHEKKLKDLLGLLDAINVSEANAPTQISPTSLAVLKPIEQIAAES